MSNDNLINKEVTDVRAQKIGFIKRFILKHDFIDRYQPTVGAILGLVATFLLLVFIFFLSVETLPKNAVRDFAESIIFILSLTLSLSLPIIVIAGIVVGFALGKTRKLIFLIYLVLFLGIIDLLMFSSFTFAYYFYKIYPQTQISSYACTDKQTNKKGEFKNLIIECDFNIKSEVIKLYTESGYIFFQADGTDIKNQFNPDLNKNIIVFFDSQPLPKNIITHLAGTFENITPGMHTITHEISGRFLSETFPSAGFYILEGGIGLYTKEDTYLGRIEYKYKTSRVYKNSDFIE